MGGVGPTANAAPTRSEVVVIGAGPGGAVTAAHLAEAGRQVLLIEEGDHLPLESCRPFSLEEMVQKYRNGGLTPALGRTKVSYVEGRCVGGGSEINSGLYHRTPPDILERWRQEHRVEGIDESDMAPHFEDCERSLSVSFLPGPAPPASLKLHEGAARLGWKSLEVPRWFRYDETAVAGSANAGSRQSMTRTYIPRALRSGCTLLPGTRIDAIRREGPRWLVMGRRAGGSRVQVEAETLFLCAGAVQTPALLRRSGITRNIGNSLQIHPTIKLVAQFPDDVNDADMGVPVHQVKEFAPALSFGCSISSLPYLALGLLEHPHLVEGGVREWRRSAIYYAMITPSGTGRVRCLPGFRDPVVWNDVPAQDLRLLATGLRKLGELLFAAGARTLVPGTGQCPAIGSPAELGRWPAMLPAGRTNLMTIHLFSSCPMGEDARTCATDSFGRVVGMPGLHVNDASLLCTAPGVNPQGSVMAIARRNALKFLGRI